MTIKKALVLSSTIGIALAVSNMAFALDSRCSSQGVNIPHCIGTAVTKGTPQKPLLVGLSNYGLIAKDFNYLVPEHAGGSDAEGCCGSWTAGIAVAGHMSAPDDWNPNYKKGAIGLYVDNVGIKGGSSWQRVAGVLHYNLFSTTYPHGDYAYLDNVNIDIINTNTAPLTDPSKWWAYPAYGIMSYTEGTNKSDTVTVGGKSNIKVETVCKIGEACFVGDLDSSGVSATSIQGPATVDIDEDVTIEAIGDMVHGEVVHTRVASSNAVPDGKIINKGTVSTNGTSSSALRILNEWSIGEKATVINMGELQTEGEKSDGILSTGYTNNILVNGGKIYALNKNSSAISIFERVINNNPNVAILKLTESSFIYGGSDEDAAGVKLSNLSGVKSITNEGEIFSANNKSIYVKNSRAGKFTLENSGTIQGYQTIQDNDVSIINQEGGTFMLENSSSDGYNTPVISQFSNQNTAIFENNGMIAFDSASGTDSNIGTYTGIKAFYTNETGHIDLTTNNPVNTALGVGKNNLANDRFTITNSTNDAIYYSNGGTISLNVDLTKASETKEDDRLSDRLILDKVLMSEGTPTLINIVPTKASLTKSKPTVGDGFLVIEVKGASQDHAFKLAKPLKIGKNQYDLQKIGNNWYLKTIEN